MLKINVTSVLTKDYEKNYDFRSLCADDVGDFHKARGVVAGSFRKFVEDKSDGFVEVRNDNVFEDVDPSSCHL